MKPGCTTSGQVICDPASAADIPAGPTVTVATGQGRPPLAAGGMLHDGSYQLVAVTIYGKPPPNQGDTRAGDLQHAVLRVHCDHYDELTGWKDHPGEPFSGNACGRLVPRRVSLLEASGAAADAGDGFPDEVMYTAKGTTLTLIHLQSIADFGRGLITGSYTVVKEYALLDASSLSDAATQPGTTGAVAPPPSDARDPRCPPKPPAQGRACTPDPSPLQCEYGGDAWGRCTTLAICALQPDGAFGFEVSSDSACGANDPACPDAFGTGTQSGAAPALDAGTPDAGEGSDLASTCSAAHLRCSYEEGTCGCVPELARGPQKDAGPNAFATVLHWKCLARAEVPHSPAEAPPCPAQRPLAGDGCATAAEDEYCAYANACQPETSVGPEMICLNGYWQQADTIAFCGLRPAI